MDIGAWWVGTELDTTEQLRVMRKLSLRDAEWLPKVMQLISVRTETRQSVFRDLNTQQHSVFNAKG